MRKTLSVALVVVAATFSMPTGLIAAGATPLQGGLAVAPNTGTVNGVATDSSKTPVSQATVRLRPINAPPGTGVASTVTDAAGNFSFTGVNPAQYVIEIVDAAGKVIGVSPSITVVAGAATTLTVSTSIVSALAIASGATGAAAFITSTAGLLTIIAAGGLAVAGGTVIVEDASPSR
jgi:hypothetical protein